MKNEKGYTGVDISISIIVITIFIALIALLISKFNSGVDDLELKSKAIDIAIQEIERIKTIGVEAENTAANPPLQAVENQEGFYKKIEIEDYADGHSERVPGLVKKATVTVWYNFNNQEKNVELSTILAKEL